MRTDAFSSLEFEPRWVAWRNELRNDKWTKVPHCPHSTHEAKADDPATWNTRSAAEARAKNIVNGQGGGIGLQLGDLGDGFSLGGVDLDTCRQDDGMLEPWAVDVIKRFGSYTEISPSGTGVKVFFKYRTDDMEKLRPALGSAKYGRQFKRGTGKDHPPAIEVYLGNRYFAVTEQRLEWVPDEIVTVDVETLLWLLTEYGPAFSKSNDNNTSDEKTAGYDKSRSGSVFRLAKSLRLNGFTYEQFVEAARTNPETAEWCREKGEANRQRELRRAWENAAPKADNKQSEGVTLSDFHAYMPMHSYIYTPTRALWPAASVSARIPPIPRLDENGNQKLDGKGGPIFLTAAQWLDRNQPVEQMTWAPGLPEIIEDRLLYEGGWIRKPGVRAFNQYLAPTIILGDADKADKWIDHLQYVYPDDAEHMLDWYAHRVQRPQEKINHALVMGGSHGIGKDTILEPVKQGIGPWNFQEASPGNIMGRFNGFLKAVILRVNEARDLGESDRFKFYDHMKTLIASPPDTLRIDEKFRSEYLILNVCGVIITTNHKTDGIYLPAEDRRHYVAWSDRVKEDERFAGDYWPGLYAYYQDGGNEAVTAYLMQRDMSRFDPKALPPKTPAFWAIVDANRPSEEAELTNLLESMNWPKGFTMGALQDQAMRKKELGLLDWLQDRKNRRAIPHRLEKVGYTPVRNPDASDGLWKHGSSRKVIYVQVKLSLREQVDVAQNMVERASETGQ